LGIDLLFGLARRVGRALDARGLLGLESGQFGGERIGGKRRGPRGESWPDLGGGARTDSFEAETRFNLCINIGFSVGRKSAVVLAALVYLGPSIGGTE